jgi:hypothetical protein
MQSWQEFLDSLATKGGNLLVLFVCFAGLLSLLIHVLHHGDTGNVSMVVVSTFSGFSGALMATLTGKDSKEQSENTPGMKIPSNRAASAIPESAATPSSGTSKIDGPVS